MDAPDDSGIGERVPIGRINVRVAEQAIEQHAAAVVDGLRDDSFDIVDITLLDDHWIDIAGIRRFGSRQATP